MSHELEYQQFAMTLCLHALPLEGILPFYAAQKDPPVTGTLLAAGIKCLQMR